MLLPQEVTAAWEKREGPVVFTTVGADGEPNAIYASIVQKLKDGRIAITDNYFDKTLTNLTSGGGVSVLFLTTGGTSYQIKGAAEYSTSGRFFDDMLTWADPKHPRKGVVVINHQEVYRGSEKLT
jgi:uncharacterized protein